MEITLCGEKGCCPSVKIDDSVVTIGEYDNTVTLKREEWNELVNLIKTDKLREI